MASAAKYYFVINVRLCRRLGRPAPQAAEESQETHARLTKMLGGDGRRVVGAQNFALLSRMALTFLRRETTSKDGVPTKRKQAGWDTDYLLRVFMAGIIGL